MRRRAVPFVLVGLICLTLISITLSRTQSAASRFFSEALRTHNVSADVTVHERILTVRAGEVTFEGGPVSDADAFEALRLTYARTLAERSPLFALPGTSPSDLNYAVDELRRTANQLADIQKNAASADLIRSSLYPLDFLRKAASAEAARIAFVNTADAIHEQAYYDAVRKEFTSYILGIQNFRRGVIRAVPDSIPPYVAAGKLVSKEALLSALQNLETGAKKMMGVFDARTTCLRGYTSHCNPQNLSLPTLPEPIANTISNDSIQTASSIQSMYRKMGIDDQPLPAPLIVLSQSVCASDFPNPPIYHVMVPNLASDVPPFRRGAYIGDIRLIDISAYGNIPFYHDLQSRGIRFVLSPPLLHYECMEEARDLSAILFTEDVMREASPTSRVYYESEAVRIANNRARAGDPDGIRYILSAQNHSSRFDQTLRDISWIEQTNMGLMKGGVGADLRTYNLFFSRSGFASLFAAGNPSFVGKISLFDSVSIPTSEKPYIYYSNLPDEKTRGKVLEDIRNYISIHLAEHPSSMP